MDQKRVIDVIEEFLNITHKMEVIFQEEGVPVPPLVTEFRRTFQGRILEQRGDIHMEQ